MGRARGDKKNHASTPAPGRGAWPSALDELQEIGGMSSAWHARNHLVQDALGDVQVQFTVQQTSDVFPGVSAEELISLVREPWSHARLQLLFDDVDRDLLAHLEKDDPFVESFWKQEKLRAEWTGLDLERFQDTWKRNFILEVQLALVAADPDPHEIAYSLPNMLLDDERQLLRDEEQDALRDRLEQMSKQNPDLFQRVAREELLPAYAQGLGPFWMHLGEQPISAHFSKALLQSWFPSLPDAPNAFEKFEDRVQAPFSWSEQDRNLFYSEMLHGVAFHIGRNSGNDFYPKGDALYEEFVLEGFLPKAACGTIRRFFKGLRHKNYWDEELQEICGKAEWQRLHQHINNNLQELEGYDEDELPEFVSDRLADQCNSKAVGEMLRGERSFADIISSSLEI